MSDDSFVLGDKIKSAVTELRPHLSGGISILLKSHGDYYKMFTNDGDKPDEKFGYNETVSNIEKNLPNPEPGDLIKLLKEVVTMRVYAVAKAYETEIAGTVKEVEDKVQEEIVRQTHEHLSKLGVSGPGDVLGIPNRNGGGKRRKSKRRKSKRSKSMKRRKSKKSKKKTRRKKR